MIKIIALNHERIYLDSYNQAMNKIYFRIKRHNFKYFADLIYIPYPKFYLTTLVIFEVLLVNSSIGERTNRFYYTTGKYVVRVINIMPMSNCNRFLLATIIMEP